MSTALKLQPHAVHAFADAMAKAAPFESNPHLAIAVSGGSDSMALLLLAKHWVDARHGHISALTVDHGLRAESHAEAEQVGHWCKTLDITHHILSWQPPDYIQGSVQAVAREARYRLLHDWCQQHMCMHVLTAHQCGDQAETFWFRLARGSGPEGLSAMPLQQLHGAIRLLRPLLSVPKGILKDLLSAQDQAWIEDRSNQNMRFARTRIRHYLARHPKEVIADSAALAARFGQWRQRMDRLLVSHLTNSISLYPEAYAILRRGAFMAVPPSLSLPLLHRVTLTLNGDMLSQRSHKLERLEEYVRNVPTRRHAFGGLLWTYQPRHNTILITREWQRLLSPISMHPNTSSIWDRRFSVFLPAHYPMLQLRALGQDGMHHLARSDFRSPPMEKSAFYALPSLWHLDMLVAIPHIGYYHEMLPAPHCRIRFMPAKSLAAPAFFSMNNRQPSLEEET